MTTYINLFIETFPKFWNALQHGNVLPLGYWNYFFLFIFVIIQGPLVKLLSGAVASTTNLNLYLVILVSILASMTADIGWYYLGRLGKLQKRKSKHTKRKQIAYLLQNAMHEHYFKVLVLGKISLGLAIPSMVAAGVVRISWRKWLPAVFVGEFLYTIMLILTGYFAAESLNHANQTIRFIGLAITGIFLLVLVIYLPYSIRKTLVKENPQLDHPIDV